MTKSNQNYSKLHAKIYISDLRIQSCFKSVHACIIYQALVRNSNIKNMTIENGVMTRISYPSQQYFQDNIPKMTRYRIKKGISDLKNIDINGNLITDENSSSSIPVLTVKKRMGNSAIYILKTNFKTVDHDEPCERSNMNDHAKGRTWSTIEKSNMMNHGKVEHGRPETINYKQNNKQYNLTEEEVDFSYLFED